MLAEALVPLRTQGVCDFLPGLAAGQTRMGRNNIRSQSDFEKAL